MNEVMNCSRFEEQLNAYLDNELGVAARDAFAGHAKACPECAQKLEMASRLQQMCLELDEGLTIPLDVQAAWRKAIREEAAKNRKSSARTWIRTLGAVAAVAVLLVGGTFALRAVGPLSLVAPNAANNQLLTYAALDEAGSQASKYKDMAGGAESRAMTPSLATDSAMDDMLMPSPTDEPEVGSDTGVDSAAVKLIRSASRDIESINFDADLQALRDLVTEYDGREEHTYAYGTPIEPGQSRGRYAYLDVRIPTESLDDFLVSLDAVGVTISKSSSAEDISRQYYDTAARLETQKALRDKYQQMIAQAVNFSDLLEAEQKIADVQYEIDSLEGTIRGWNSQIDDSAVSISLSEVADRNAVQPIASSTLSERIRIGFYDSINIFNAFVQDMAVFVVLVWPWLVILIVIIVIVSAVVKRRRRRRQG